MQVLRIAAVAALLGAGPAGAAEWDIDPAKSWLGFKGTASGTAFEGRFSRWVASISFDPAHADRGHVVVLVDVSSAETGDRQKDETLSQGDWLNAEKYPKATFEAKSFRFLGDTSYEAVGTLTLRGVTKHVVMPTTIEVDGARLHASGHLDLIRTDYGVGERTGAQWVGLKVVAAFDVTARQLK